MDGEGIFRADIDETLVRADAIAADGHGLEDGVRVALQQGTVHESARITFVRVADDVLLLAGTALRGDLPLQAGGEARAATAAEAGLLDLGDHLLGGHLGEALAQGGIAVTRNGFLDVLGIDETAVAQGDAELLLVELHVLGVGHALLGVRRHIEQALDLAALDDVFLDDFLRIGRLDPGVEGVVGDDLHDGTSFAETEAAGNDHFGEIGQVVGHELLVEFLNDLMACGCGATCSTAYQDMHFYCHNRTWGR